MLMGRGVVALAGLLVTSTSLFAQAVDPGRRAFEARCARCHGADGRGGEMGPAIAERLTPLDDQQLMKLIREGQPLKGMPPNVVPDAEMADLVKFLRTIERTGERPLVRMSVQTTDGRTLDGLVLGEGFDDLQLRTDDKRVHLLRRAGDRVPRGDVGDAAGRPTTATRAATATRRSRRSTRRPSRGWRRSGCSPIPDAGQLQGTPVVVDGIMYVTAPNECFALDAGSGRRIWHFKRPRTKGIAGGGANRGAAVAGDRVFMVTDNAHLIALNRFTGDVLWETELADWRQNYAASSAPLPAGNLVISGVSGGEHGANGFVAAHDQETGKEVWRFWTVPKPGEPGSETWQGKDIEHGGAPTWFTGSYDPALDIVYWPTGNPSQGVQRRRSHRATTSTRTRSSRSIARPATLKWHYQFTPHDLWDWDATQTSVLVDADWEGQPRKLMLHASAQRLLLRVRSRDGKLLLAKPFVRNLTWASGIGADGRPDQACRTRSRRPPAPRSARRRTARPTGSRRRSIRRPGSTTCRRSRSAASTRRREQGDVGERQVVSRRIAADGDRSRSRSGS